MTPPDLPRYRLRYVARYDEDSHIVDAKTGELAGEDESEFVLAADHAVYCAHLHQQLADMAGRAAEWDAIQSLLSDREEVGLYAKVEALLNESR